MKAEELRIGNLIQWENDSIIEIINVINSKAIGLESDIPTDFLTPIKFFKPIPLTEDWLIKFGFEKIGVNYSLDEFIIYVRISDKKMVYRTSHYSIELRHVHQLQNLYFALTGKELKLNQPQG